MGLQMNGFSDKRGGVVTQLFFVDSFVGHQKRDNAPMAEAADPPRHNNGRQIMRPRAAIVLFVQ